MSLVQENKTDGQGCSSMTSEGAEQGGSVYYASGASSSSCRYRRKTRPKSDGKNGKEKEEMY